MPKTVRNCPLLGIPLAATDYAGAVALTRSWADEPCVRAVAAANTHVVALGRHERDFNHALSQFDLIVPDGMPLVWAMNRRGAGLRDRVYGPTLMLHALAQPGVPHFLLGGSEELLERLTAKLRADFPGVLIAGSYSPPFCEWSDAGWNGPTALPPNRAGFGSGTWSTTPFLSATCWQSRSGALFENRKGGKCDAGREAVAGEVMGHHAALVVDVRF